MNISKILRKLESVSYTCVSCGHIENISEVECTHCHKIGTVIFDRSKNYPVICRNCRDKGWYVKCSKCKESVYHGAFKTNLVGLTYFVVAALFVATAITVIMTW